MVPKTVLAGPVGDVIFACDTAALRGVNAWCLAALTYFCLRARGYLEGQASGYALHSAVNIALCPVIFFFSGLYYTDVASAAVVVAAFVHALRRMGSPAVPSLGSDLLTILLGLASLFMRQTNIFWVVVFAGGLEAVHAVKSCRPALQTVRPDSPRLWALTYASGNVHDPPLDMSWPDGKETLPLQKDSIC